MTLTREAVVATAKELVKEFGEDYVYPGADRGGCSYSGDEDYGVPACVVGQIVKRLDPEMYTTLTLVEHEDTNVTKRTDFNHTHLEYPPDWAKDYQPTLDTGDDAELTRALRQAQAQQDNGAPWGEALKPVFDLEG